MSLDTGEDTHAACVTPSNLMLIIDTRHTPASARRFLHSTGATAERLYARFVKLCKVHGGGSLSLSSSRASLGQLRSRGTRAARGIAHFSSLAAEMQMVTSRRGAE